jgi:hypothetical protein
MSASSSDAAEAIKPHSSNTNTFNLSKLALVG